MQTDRLPLILAAVLSLTLLLAGCAQVPPQPEARPDPDIARAQALESARDHLGASALYEALATRLPGTQAQDFMLRAIENALQGGDLDRTEALLARIAPLPLTAPQRLLAGLLRGELQLARRQADRALDTLLGLRLPRMPQDLQRRHLRDLATAYRQLGNLLESANTLIRLDALLQDREQRLAVQSEILQALTALNERTLRELRPSPPGVPGGWMDLALLLKQHGGQAERLTPLLAEWRNAHPRHPALPELLQRFAARLREQVRQVDHIAVLLPEQGRYAGAARALRDGLMISLYELPEAQRPLLRFYDSSDPASVWPLYTQVVAAGAQAVIGPLQKDAVRQLLRAGELTVPVLALNKVDSDAPPPENLFMFSLDPEHEAGLVAERIWQDGLRRPVALVPDTPLGARLERAFRARWQTLTGEDLDSRRYDPNSTDHSAPISALLHIDRSKARHARLQHWLGRRITFEPRRRADVDAVFMVATPRQAQSIKPQLAFFHAADLPSYATSLAWSGRLTPQQLADMRGIRLPDIPLIVNREARQRLGQRIPGVLGGAVRLYAMGIDALRLQPNLRRLREDPWASLDGQTGNLYMNPDGRIERQLLWIALDEPPKVLGYSNRMDLDDISPKEAAPAESRLPGQTAEPLPAASR